MRPDIGDRRSQILHWVCGVATLGGAAFYLAQWLQMPLYPDEVAFRLLKARFLADGAQEYWLFAQCPAATQITPLPLRPVAYLFSVFDASFGWSLIRDIPLIGVLLTVIAALILVLGRRSPAAALLVAAGFVGVAGAGLVLFRMETALIYYGAACLAGYALLQRDKSHPAAIVAYFVISTGLALFAFLAHLQSLVLAPIGLLLAAGFIIRQRSAVVRLFAVLSTICIVAGAAATAKVPVLHCPELPNVERFVDVMTLPGLAKHEGLPGVTNYLSGKLDRYRDQFLFKARYDENYLPGVITDIRPTFYKSLNALVSWMVLLNLLIACGSLLWGSIETVRLLVSKGPSFRQRIYLLITAPPVYLSLAIAGHLGLLIVDVPTNFYRVFYINFALAIINAVALAHLRGPARLALWPVGGLGLAACVLSATVTLRQIEPTLAAGWSGPSIPLKTNWSAVRLNVMKVAGKCGIAPGDRSIFIDDMTFDAMKAHQHLMPITYVGVAYNPADPAAKTMNDLVRSLGATFALARCGNFTAYKIDPDVRADDLCCAKL